MRTNISHQLMQRVKYVSAERTTLDLCWHSAYCEQIITDEKISRVLSGGRNAGPNRSADNRSNGKIRLSLSAAHNRRSATLPEYAYRKRKLRVALVPQTNQCELETFCVICCAHITRRIATATSSRCIRGRQSALLH